MLVDERFGVAAHGFTAFGVCEEVVEGLGGGVKVVGGDDQAVDAVLDDIVDSAVAGGEDGFAGAHGFQEDGGEGFVPADKGEGIGPDHFLEELFLGEQSEELDPGLELKAGDGLFDEDLLFATAGDP